jgi:hypothetical protein
MGKATKTIATWLGIAAGLAGMEHGYFEIRKATPALPAWPSHRWGHSVTLRWSVTLANRR